jgi:PTS system nitrogen regulatory IIA component
MSQEITIDHILATHRATNWRNLYDLMSMDVFEYTKSTNDFHAGTLCKRLIDKQGGHKAAIGDGVAIPQLCVEGLERSFLMFAKPHQPIDFGADDGLDVDLVFLLLSPKAETGEHLRSLSRLTRMVMDDHLRSCLRATNDIDALYSILHDPVMRKVA